jgi:DNA-binding MarR family transcriptional regulator
MKRRLQEEIQQTKPFASLEEEVHIQIVLTAQVANRVLAEALKPSGLSPSQFNVLRILRGARPGALPAGRIAERMVNHDPDLTRLLDRLEATGLVQKARDSSDRRVVNAKITKAGLERVEGASKSVSQAIRTSLASIEPRKLEQLADLLELARDATRTAVPE